MAIQGRSGRALIRGQTVLAGILLGLACLSPSFASAAPRPTLGPGGPLPLAFEPNQGQADQAVRFVARGRGYGLFLSPTESVLVLTPPNPAGSVARRPQAVVPAALPPTVVRMRLVGADPDATISGVDALPGRNHYLIGDKSRWQRNVPTFARVHYRDVYPGISLIF